MLARVNFQHFDVNHISSQSLFKQYVAQQLDMIKLASLGTLEEEGIGGRKF